MKEKIFCNVCKTQTEYVIDSFSRYHLKPEHNLTLKQYYDNYIKKENEGYCQICGKETIFRRFYEGYRRFCSSKCVNKSIDVKNKMNETRSTYTLEKKENIIKKRIDTNIKKWGVSYYSKLEEVKEIKKNKMFNKEYKKYEKLFDDNKIKIVQIKKSKIKCKCDVCNNEFIIQKQMIRKRELKNKKICTICNPYNKKTSNNHLEIVDFLKENNIQNIQINNRIELNGLELDIYLPDFRLAFEYNGVYWHSELYKDTTYHLDKTKICIDKNIKLIHVYEDDWNYKQDIVKSRILNLLGKSEKIYARKCIIKEIDNNTTKIFLEKNHIQGEINSKHRIGLYYNNELVSLMAFSNSRFEKNKIELIRFCNKLGTSVVGGASKLFKHFIKNYDVHNEIVSYADRSWSTGNLYENLGFKLMKELNPNYQYVVDGLRENRFKYRKSELIKEGYDKNKTEHEIMTERDIYRIYDSGSLKYIYKYFK